MTKDLSFPISKKVYKEEPVTDPKPEKGLKLFDDLVRAKEAEQSVTPSVQPQPVPEQKAYIPMLNAPATNQLTHISSSVTPPVIDLITGNATIRKGTLSVSIDGYGNLKGLRASTLKLLDACTIHLTEQNTYQGNDDKINVAIEISLPHYGDLCGIPDTKPSRDKLRRRVKEDLETLYHISLDWTEPAGKSTRDFAKIRICDKVGIERGKICFNFSSEMAKYLTTAYLMQYPIELLKVDDRNPNLYPLGRKLLLHHSIDNNVIKKTANIISVKALLDVCPAIPSYEEVLKTDRHLERKIKTPFETALNAIPFIRWEYSNSKGIPLTDEQLEAADYATFIELFIHFEVEGTIDRMEQIKAKREEAKAKAKTRTKTRSKKASKKKSAGEPPKE